MYIHGPFADSGNRNTQSYSDFYRRVLEADGSIYIDFTVISEFLNRYIRQHHDLLKQEGSAPDRYKDFRESAEYKDIADGAADDLYHILANCHRIDFSVKAIDFDSLLKELREGRMDMSDILIDQQCNEHGLLLVTHDSDFLWSRCPIATFNQKLLSAAADG
jgi:predicted nucleic acid-binding protein